MSFSVTSLGLPPVQTSANTSFESCSVRFRKCLWRGEFAESKVERELFHCPNCRFCAVFGGQSVDNDMYFSKHHSDNTPCFEVIVINSYTNL